MDKVNKANIDRFSGFADTYDKYRPTPPDKIIDIVGLYCKDENRPALVVDVGSGTGLSTAIWANNAERVIGIEPNSDMRSVAVEMNKEHKNIEFIEGVSNDLPFQDESVDVVTISQAFHWMDSETTLNEIFRILKKEGTLAIYYCNWPPNVNWAVENEYMTLREKCDEIVFSNNKARRKEKEEHIESVKKFGRFRFSKEIVFHKDEFIDADRMMGITLSQGGIQSALKLEKFRDEISNDLRAFEKTVRDNMADMNEAIPKTFISYHVIIAVK